MSYYIYKITNIQNNKSYIGLTTKTVEQRWQQHIQAAYSNSKDANELLKRAIRKYGVNSFKIDTIEICIEDLEYLKQREQYWIDFYNTYAFKEGGKGYNMTIGGDCPTYNHSIPIQRIDILTGEILESFSSISIAEDKYHRGIREIVAKKSNAQIPKGSTWIKTNESYDLKELYLRYNIICQLSLSGDLIAYHLDSEEASKSSGASSGNLRACLTNRRKSANNYQWCYYKDLSTKINKKYLCKKNNKKVGQYDLCDNLIHIYDSATEASLKTGTHISKISAVCNGKRKTSNGFKWRYIDNDRLS